MTELVWISLALPLIGVALLAAVEAGARTLAELVEATGLSRPTAHRLAAALVANA